MKIKIIALGAGLGTVLHQLGEFFTEDMLTLCIFMGVDYVLGIACAIVNKSPKSKTGGLNSEVGYKGLIKKMAALLLILVAHRLDMMVDGLFLADICVISTIINELISILENLGLMGVKIPNQIASVIDVLKNKGGDDHDR